MSSSFEYSFLTFIVLTNALIGGIVFFRNTKSSSNRLFAVLCLSFGLWSIINYFSLHIPFGSELFWIRLVMLSAAPQIGLFYFFVNTFPEEKISLSKSKIFISDLLLSLQMGVAVSPWLYNKIVIVDGKAVPQAGPGMILFVAVVVYFMLSGTYVLFRKLIFSKDEFRKALVFIVGGFTATVFLFIYFLLYQVLINQNTYFVPLAPIFVFPFLIGTSYAIIRQKFLNLRLVATEFVVGIFTISLLVEALNSGSIFSILWKLVFSAFVLVLGYLLIRSVYKEIERREQVTELAKSLETANIQLKELDRQKTDFLSIAAHQLRTPLSIMNGYIELLRDGAYGAVTKEQTEVYRNIDESNGHLVKLVDSFLDITRLEQGRTKYDFIEHNINDLVDGVVKELEIKAKTKEIKIAWQRDDNFPKVIYDEEKIRHVIYNFIDNAIKYSDKGEIHVDIAKDGEGIAVRVRDNGIGFDKVDEVNFFQKFYRGNNVQGMNVNGTGLGLYVCSKFISAHRGRVWGKSLGVGKGSEFGFWIPLHQA